MVCIPNIQFELVLPRDGRLFREAPATPTLQAEPVEGATGYVFRVSDAPDFSSVVAFTPYNHLPTDPVWVVDEPLDVGTYYWQAAAVGSACGMRGWSESRQFSVADGTGSTSCPVLYAFNGHEYRVKEVDCWGSGDRVCRFTIDPA